mmetsp:Transcript_84593/g.248063  ORF Transcript_84593/g.248063 Transcript_84593/m.248063 type:complete len:652 (+) Transcript_84593:480-2435(+)
MLLAAVPAAVLLVPRLLLVPMSPGSVSLCRGGLAARCRRPMACLREALADQALGQGAAGEAAGACVVAEDQQGMGKLLRLRLLGPLLAKHQAQRHGPVGLDGLDHLRCEAPAAAQHLHVRAGRDDLHRWLLPEEDQRAAGLLDGGQRLSIEVAPVRFLDLHRGDVLPGLRGAGQPEGGALGAAFLVQDPLQVLPRSLALFAHANEHSKVPEALHSAAGGGLQLLARGTLLPAYPLCLLGSQLKEVSGQPWLVLVGPDREPAREETRVLALHGSHHPQAGERPPALGQREDEHGARGGQRGGRVAGSRRAAVLLHALRSRLRFRTLRRCLCCRLLLLSLLAARPCLFLLRLRLRGLQERDDALLLLNLVEGVSAGPHDVRNRVLGDLQLAAVLHGVRWRLLHVPALGVSESLEEGDHEGAVLPRPADVGRGAEVLHGRLGHMRQLPPHRTLRADVFGQELLLQLQRLGTPVRAWRCALPEAAVVRSCVGVEALPLLVHGPHEAELRSAALQHVAEDGKPDHGLGSLLGLFHLWGSLLRHRRLWRRGLLGGLFVPAQVPPSDLGQLAAGGPHRVLAVLALLLNDRASGPLRLGPHLDFITHLEVRPRVAQVRCALEAGAVQPHAGGAEAQGLYHGARGPAALADVASALDLHA